MNLCLITTNSYKKQTNKTSLLRTASLSSIANGSFLSLGLEDEVLWSCILELQQKSTRVSPGIHCNGILILAITWLPDSFDVGQLAACASCKFPRELCSISPTPVFFFNLLWASIIKVAFISLASFNFPHVQLGASSFPQVSRTDTRVLGERPQKKREAASCKASLGQGPHWSFASFLVTGKCGIFF